MDLYDLVCLEDGWMEGIGKAPSQEIIEIIRRIILYLRDNLSIRDNPSLQPKEDGSIIIYWKRVKLYCLIMGDLTFTIDSISKTKISLLNIDNDIVLVCNNIAKHFQFHVLY